MTDLSVMSSMYMYDIQHIWMTCAGVRFRLSFLQNSEEIAPKPLAPCLHRLPFPSLSLIEGLYSFNMRRRPKS